MQKVNIIYIIFSNSINKKPFRLSKNGKSTDVFAKVETGSEKKNENNAEKKDVNINLIRIDESNISEKYFNEMDEDQKE